MGPKRNNQLSTKQPNSPRPTKDPPSNSPLPRFFVLHEAGRQAKLSPDQAEESPRYLALFFCQPHYLHDHDLRQES
ncbi:hypothetical protein LMH87_011193 [Akanthomyces muscarius]|uniref:Uncharacterized protein n=1 Tax=Akanthomyces muscarius TaxID=2231603 RepID=A0A9W8QB93_AKAMU|nr:hypothetical protein LMH87_011193 [Akanthomyces muscarius]KAJ4150443.1 hypothetical protein LMH87_011193 [Akanthomyces muscarius]